MIIAGIDTGLKRCGVAIFEDEKLTWAQLVCAEGLDSDPVVDMATGVVEAMPQKADRAVIETPQQYPNSPVPRESLEALSLVAGALSHNLPKSTAVERIYPRVWKGQVPKAVMLRRIRAHLSAEEISVVTALDLPKSSVHNVWDAVGICLWAVGRLGARKR